MLNYFSQKIFLKIKNHLSENYEKKIIQSRGGFVGNLVFLELLFNVGMATNSPQLPFNIYNQYL